MYWLLDLSGGGMFSQIRNSPPKSLEVDKFNNHWSLGRIDIAKLEINLTLWVNNKKWAGMAESFHAISEYCQLKMKTMSLWFYCFLSFELFSICFLFYFAASEVGQRNPRIPEIIRETNINFAENVGCARRLTYLGSLTIQIASKNTSPPSKFCHKNWKRTVTTCRCGCHVHCLKIRRDVCSRNR